MALARRGLGTRKQYLLLDVRSEVQQIHDLRHPGACDVAQSGEVGVVSNLAAIHHVLKLDRQRHKARDPRNPYSLRFWWLEAHATPASLGFRHIDCDFNIVHYAAPFMTSSFAPADFMLTVTLAVRPS